MSLSLTTGFCISSEGVAEGDLVAGFAAFLREHEWTVVVARPNQAAVYFTTEAGGRKGPDVVAYRNGVLLVAEAKVKAESLFVRGGRDISDAEALRLLKDSPSCQTELWIRVRGRVASKPATAPTILTALVAATPFAEQEEMFVDVTAERTSDGAFVLAGEASIRLL
jgi:hypothetical protein